MHQQTFAEIPFEQYRKSTRRERFLDEMNRVVPWAELVAVIKPVYPKADGPGVRRSESNACAPPLSATVVQPVRSGGGGGLVRLTGHAAVRGD